MPDRADRCPLLARCESVSLRLVSWFLGVSRYPTLADEPFRPWFSKQKWSTNPELLKRWQRGVTGYPLVDAAMRQLWVMGWMPNYMRYGGNFDIVLGPLCGMHALCAAPYVPCDELYSVPMPVAVLGAHAHWMRVGACDPMPSPIHVSQARGRGLPGRVPEHGLA